MEAPPGFDGNFCSNYMCRVKKALYGLKQSPKVWFERFAKVMLRMKYEQNPGDHTLFIKHSTS